MRPKVTILCMTTQDGGYASKVLDQGLYYEIGYSIGADAVLAGADSMLTGLGSFEGIEYREEPSVEKSTDDSLPYLVVTDSRGRLAGRLGFYRNMEYIRDAIVLISDSTPREYKEYLEQSHCPFLKAGLDRCDLRKCVELLAEEHGIRHLRVDAVGSLASAFIGEGLADEIWVISSPYILKSPSPRAFENLVRDVRLELVASEAASGGYVLSKYLIEPSASN